MLVDKLKWHKPNKLLPLLPPPPLPFLSVTFVFLPSHFHISPFCFWKISVLEVTAPFWGEAVSLIFEFVPELSLITKCADLLISNSDRLISSWLSPEKTAEFFNFLLRLWNHKQICNLIQVWFWNKISGEKRELWVEAAVVSSRSRRPFSGLAHRLLMFYYRQTLEMEIFGILGREEGVCVRVLQLCVTLMREGSFRWQSGDGTKLNPYL